MIYKCYTCNKIGHLTKNCKVKEKLCPKCNNNNCTGTCLKSIWKGINCGGSHSANYTGCLSIKSAISKSMDRRQNLSYAQAVCRGTAKEEIEAFKANIIMNIHQLTKIITTVLWEINRDDFNTNQSTGLQIGSNCETIRKHLHRLKMALLNSSFNSSKLKLAHINICSCRINGVQISLFLK